jgi:pimeloyl-ACP methyl ester carboxylesterase
MKYNLILVHSFPTNSILLKGLAEYLGQFFHVYMIDLPGFTRAVPPLSSITIQKYARFVENRVAELGLESYLVGGISFGFMVVNQARYADGRCLGILALEPFIGTDSLRMSAVKKFLYRTLINTVLLLKADKSLWHSPILRQFFTQRFPEWTVNTVLDQIDSRTYFETARAIFNEYTPVEFQNLPYILAINKDDDTVDYPYIHQMFTSHVKRLLLINSTIDHYPEDLSPEYFRKTVPESVFQEMSNFIAQENPQRK